MALATYADLQASIAGWLHRSDLTAIIPDFIELAEKRINGDLDARLQDTAAALASVADVATVAIPSDLINLRSLTVISSPNRVLDYLTPDQFNAKFSDDRSGVPQSFSIIGGSIYLGPTPDTAYALQCVYKAKVPALAASGTNWLMTDFPQAYLMASLAASVMYTKDLESLPAWEKQYADAIASVNKTDWYSGSTMRVRGDVRM